MKKPKFPQIYNIKDVLPIIKDNPAFIVAEKDGYTVIDYVYSSDKLFRDPIEIECRGLKFDRLTGNIIARPYHKFHNWGERQGYMPEDINLDLPHTRLEKLDGSMIHNACVGYINSQGITYRKWHLMTRMGISEVAKQAYDWLFSDENVANGLTDNHMEMWEWFPAWTFIYEYVGPNNKIVVDYEKENLILTGARRIVTGDYKTYDELVKLGYAYNIPVVQPYEGDVETDDQSEGEVVRFDHGGMIKIKSPIYVRRHRSKEILGSFKDVVKLIVDGTLDDILPSLEENDKTDILEYQESLNSYIGVLAENLITFTDSYSNLDQKEFALKLNATNDLSSAKKSILFNIRKGINGREAVLGKISNAYTKTSKLEVLFEELNLPTWKKEFFRQ